MVVVLVQSWPLLSAVVLINFVLFIGMAMSTGRGFMEAMIVIDSAMGGMFFLLVASVF